MNLAMTHNALLGARVEQLQAQVAGVEALQEVGAIPSAGRLPQADGYVQGPMTPPYGAPKLGLWSRVKGLFGRGA